MFGSKRIFNWSKISGISRINILNQSVLHEYSFFVLFFFLCKSFCVNLASHKSKIQSILNVLMYKIYGKLHEYSSFTLSSLAKGDDTLLFSFTTKKKKEKRSVYRHPWLAKMVLPIPTEKKKIC